MWDGSSSRFLEILRQGFDDRSWQQKRILIGIYCVFGA